MIDEGRALYYAKHKTLDTRTNKTVYNFELDARGDNGDVPDADAVTSAKDALVDAKAKATEHRKHVHDAKMALLEQKLQDRKDAVQAELDRYESLSPKSKKKEDDAKAEKAEARLIVLKTRLIVDQARKLSLVDFTNDSTPFSELPLFLESPLL